ncbi:Vasoactive intestinal polypeptide receptor 2 [Myotis davidii]|uniref:Vasoactive intestinal polypeptide receptor 2 n=1 Tax=Myotis davidii TaxID=225400 RepID=L5MHA8_MYODS|nr:Vasoactive intestinal polypeptide receptor 2 [Myotis davidii]
MPFLCVCHGSSCIEHLPPGACSGVWDNLTCWRPADIGETVTVPCPTVFKVFSSLHGKPGNISKNCTSAGWSQTFPDFMDACGYRDPEDRSQITFYALVKATYTLGYSVSLASLTTGSVILCLFRRLHCTRNYIHLNLFLSFILRAVSVLVKDDVLYSGSSTLHCPDQLASWVGCKLSLVLFQYCIMANFYWLLVEGLHLHTLLAASFSPGRRFQAYLLIGRLAKSTLLLIPLFGIHYMVFAVLPTGTSSRYRLLFELCVGSFQGLVVAVLYCFLNSDVQSELRRKWQNLCPRQPSGWGDRLHSLSISRNGSESTLPSHRGSHSSPP